MGGLRSDKPPVGDMMIASEPSLSKKTMSVILYKYLCNFFGNCLDL